MNPSRPLSGSVFKTQEPVHRFQHAIYLTEQRLIELRAKLEAAIAKHRDQIRRSLESTDPVERDAAHGVAVYYEVLPHPPFTPEA